MSNLGVTPPEDNPNADVYLVRTQVGDLNYVALDPPEAGFGSYDWLGDAEIEELLEVSNGSVTRATGYSYRKIAGYLTMSALSITTDDLRVDTTSRAKMMRDLAQDWLSSADDEDELVNASIFNIVPFGGFNTPAYVPEGTPRGRPITGDVEGDWTLDGDGYFV